jgi:hypothetical protein
MVKVINSSNETLAILENIVSPIISEDLNREFTFSFTTVIDNDKSSHVNYLNKILVEDNYFNIVYTEENRTSDELFINAQCEHVSYDLLSAIFTAGFTATGLFSAVATTLLSGTGFTVGTVQTTASETISVNESTNARQILIQLAVLYGGELEFDKYAINLLTQRGADRGVQFRYRKNLSSVSRIVDNRKKVLGLPTISYKVNVAELEFENRFLVDGDGLGEHYELGDTIQVIDEDLNLDISLRIYKESHDTEQRMQGTVEIANFVEDITDTVTTIQTTQVAKNNIYNGCSIGPDDGFVAERSDSLVKTFMNATDGIEIDLRASTTASYTPVFYVTVDTALLTAKLYLAGNAIFQGRVEIGTGDDVFIADVSAGIWLGDATFSDADFRVTMSGALTAESAILNGRFTTKSTAGTTLMDVFQDTNGGIIQVFDNSGNLNVKLGVEAASASNTGGTLILYNDTVSKPRVELGINASDDHGSINLKDSSGTARVALKGDDASTGPQILIIDSGGTAITYLLETEGYINSEQIATRNWVTSNFVHL